MEEYRVCYWSYVRVHDPISCGVSWYANWSLVTIESRPAALRNVRIFLAPFQIRQMRDDWIQLQQVVFCISTKPSSLSVAVPNRPIFYCSTLYSFQKTDPVSESEKVASTMTSEVKSEKNLDRRHLSQASRQRTLQPSAARAVRQ